MTLPVRLPGTEIFRTTTNVGPTDIPLWKSVVGTFNVLGGKVVRVRSLRCADVDVEQGELEDWNWK